MNTRLPRSQRTPRRGFVLLAVLVFIMLLSMVTISLLFSSRAEETATGASAGAEQAWAAAMSGVEAALGVAATTPDGSTEWRDQPALFRQQLVYEDGSDQWYFTVYSPGDSETPELRFGLTDEASRLHLNRPGAADLASIPRMTPTLAQAVQRHIGAASVGSPSLPPIPRSGGPAAELMDFFDPLEVGPLGGDSGSGSALVETHGPLSTLGELLRVPGFSWSLLYGEDANMNGRLDANENDGDASLPPDNQDGQLDHGMAQYFTVRSYETAVTRERRPRVNLNGAGLPSLPELPVGLTNYLAALQTAKVKLTHPAELLEAKVTVKTADGRETVVESGVGREELPQVLDLLTADTEPRREGLINLNTAGALVLATLPEIDLSLAETIVATRSGLGADRRSTSAWLFQEGVVDAARFQRIAPQLTARSFQFQFHVVGYGVPSGRYRVLEVEIDVAAGERRVTGLRDVTKLGIPFPLVGEELRANTVAGGSSQPR